MAASAKEDSAVQHDGSAHRVARRQANSRTAASSSAKADQQGLVELACECTREDCERSVKVPLYVYRRMQDADQYLLQAGHHAFAQYRTIVSIGLMRIEERA